MGKLSLNTAEGTRIELTKKQQDRVRRLYKRVSKEIGEQAQRIPSTNSEALRQQYLKKLQEQINEQLEKIGQEIEGTITQTMTQVAADVVSDNLKWMESVGLPIGGAFSHVPDEIVRAVTSGKVYAGKWSLSKAIWGNTEKTQRDINTVIAEGIAQNKSAYDIAKDLEKYVNPSAKKDWSWSKVYPGTNKKVDYNAQRLARTLVSHAYQQAFVRTTQKNPFVTKYKWLGSNSHRICPICEARNGKLFEKDELPLDHPNGMCTFVAVIEDSMEDIADRLGDWAYGKEDPALDAYAKDLYGYIPESLKSQFTDLQEEWLSPMGYSPDHMPQTFKEFAEKLEFDELEKLLKLSGGKWSDAHPYQKMEKWYNDNLLKVKPGIKTKVPTPPAISQSSGLPSISEWFKKIKSQTESKMLDLETRAFNHMTEKQRDGIRTYSGSAYRRMNSYLREIGAGRSEREARSISRISEDLIEAITQASGGLSKSALEKDLVLRRGTDLGDLAGFLPGDFLDNKEKLENMSIPELNDMFQGSLGTYHGFTSTSSLWDRGFSGDVEVLLYAPKGTAASSIMNISKFGTGEGETLLNAGTTVRVLKIEESDGHMSSDIRVFMEIIP